MNKKISVITALLLCMIISLSAVMVSADSYYVWLYDENGRSGCFHSSHIDEMLAAGWYIEPPFQTLYAENGKSKSFKKSEVAAQLSVGWYTEPVQRLYAEGKSKVFKKSEVAAQLKVGWYTEPVQRLYAEGKSKLFKKSEVAAQLSVGWYTEPVQRLYAPGKSKLFKKSEVAAQLTVGWSTSPVATQQNTATTPAGYTKMYAIDGRSKYVLNSQVTANELVGWYTEADYNLIKQGYWKQSVNLYDINTINSSGYDSMTPSKNGGITNIGTTVNGSSLKGRYEGSYIEYYLGGKYTELTGTFYLSSHHGSMPFQMYYTFIADGKTIYTTPTFNTNSYPINFKVNVKGCTKLRIESHFAGSKSANDYYRLGNLKLYKWVK